LYTISKFLQDLLRVGVSFDKLHGSEVTLLAGINRQRDESDDTVTSAQKGTCLGRDFRLQQVLFYST